MTRLILASTSPRRAELLRQIGVAFEQRGIDVDETPRQGEVAAETALRLANAKARAGLAIPLPASPARGGGERGDVAILAADTLVSIGGEALGKPRDREDGLAMLRRLSGRRHEVYTAVAMAWDGEIKAFLSVSHVDFRPLADDEMLAYWQTGEPADKAGGYAIQGHAAAFITRLEGSFSGVMGLPLFETAELLRQAGLSIWSPCPR
ncbi:MAG: septum formation inhibitor Maf [Halothiobacillaceae bacterium]|nr:MAG: septum formation inhibitor Maf [Halothiobacillaceae bacterium]